MIASGSAPCSPRGSAWLCVGVRGCRLWRHDKKQRDGKFVKQGRNQHSAVIHNHILPEHSTLHSVLHSAKRCRAYRQPLLTVSPKSLVTSHAVAPPSRTSLQRPLQLPPARYRHVESRMFQNDLISDYDKMLVSSSFHKLPTPLFVIVTSQTTAPCANTLPEAAPEAAWGCPSGCQGQPLGQPLHS